MIDDELAAFLRREAARRASARRSDHEIVAAIMGQRAYGASSRLAPILATTALVILVAVASAVGLIGAPNASAPTASTSPVASATRTATADPPLRLPGVTTGGPCPTTHRWLIGTDGFPDGAAIGGMPVYAFLAESGHPAFYEDVGLGQWNRIDVLWVTEPGFEGRFVVRAARLDGSGDVSFADITERVPLPRVEIDTSWGRPIRTGEWRVIGHLPMLVREPGCYGMQIDAAGGSTVSVFEVRPVEEAYAELAGRSLRLPTVPPGEVCPATPTSGSVSFQGFVGGVIGDGPVYLSGAGRAIWVADSRELGPILVRGGRIDGPGELRFEAAAARPELRLPIHSYVESPGQPVGWRQFISELAPSAPGCYAVQIDTLARTGYLVFEAEP